MNELNKAVPNNPEIWKFVLYKAGDTTASSQAESTLRSLCDHYLPNRYELDIVDIRENMDAVPTDVLAVPTVIRISPRPEKRVIGDLRVMKRTMEGLGLDEELLLRLPQSGM